MHRCNVCHRRVSSARACPRDGPQPQSNPPVAPAPSEPPSLPDIVVLGRLGAGGFASVWDALWSAEKKPAAVKLGLGADALFRERFAREAEAYRLVGVPHVPALYAESALPDGRPYIVMERLFGCTLADVLAEADGPLALPHIATILEPVLESVAAAHACKILHRDLKPENIFLPAIQPMRSRLLDFGLTRTLQDQPVAADLTGTGTVIGTPEYMSPEQVQARSDVDERADIYSLGVILFELLTLRPPFVGSSGEIADSHAELRAPAPSEYAEVPAAIDDLVARCLVKDPARRFASVDELREAFRRALAADATPAKRTSVTSVATSPPAGSARERRQAALLFFSTHNLADAQRLLKSHQGAILRMTGEKLVGACFGTRTDQILRRGIAAAQGLCDRQLCERVLIDCGEVVVRRRPGGDLLLIGGLGQGQSPPPTQSDPQGILLTGRARAAASWLASYAAPMGEDRFHLVRPAEIDAPTVKISQSEPATFLGRVAETERLLKSAKAALESRRPTLATVLSVPGLGKSHFCNWLADELARRHPDAQIKRFKGREPVQGERDPVLRELLSWALDLPATRKAGWVAATSSNPALDDAIAFFLGWIEEDDPRMHRFRFAPGVLREAAQVALGEALRQAAGRRPLCLLFDDAHWAEAQVLDALEHATLPAENLPLWLAVFARPNLETMRPWAKRAQDRHREVLAPLERDSAAALCRQLLRPAEYVADSAVEKLVERADGSPLMLTELVTGLKRDGFVRKQPGRGGWYLASEACEELPSLPTIEWLASRELGALPAAQAQYAQLAALLTAEFTADEFASIVMALPRQEFALDPHRALLQLLTAGVLRALRNHCFGFRNSLVRDAVAQAVPDEMRIRIHQAALEHYRTAALPEATRLPRLAHHAAAAGAKALAAEAFSRLGDTTRGRHAYLEAAMLYDRALENLDAGRAAERLVLLRRRADVRYRIAAYDDSLADFEQAAELAGRHADVATQIDILLEQVLALDWMQEFGRSRGLLARVEALTETTGALPPLVEARLGIMRGVVIWRASTSVAGGGTHSTLAIEHWEKAARLARTLGDEAYEVLLGALLCLGCLYPGSKRLSDARQVFDEIEALCRRNGDERHLATMYVNRAELWIATDAREALEADLRRVVTYSQRFACTPMEEHVQITMASYLHWIGEHGAAEAHARRIIELQDKLLGESSRPHGQLLLARLLFAQGKRDEALVTVRAITESQIRARSEGKLAALLLPAEQVFLRALELALADGGDSDWRETLEQAEQLSAGPGLAEILELRGVCALKQGDRQTARAQLERALALSDPIPERMKQRLRKWAAAAAS